MSATRVATNMQIVQKIWEKYGFWLKTMLNEFQSGIYLIGLRMSFSYCLDTTFLLH